MVFGHRLLVLSDAHVGATPPAVEEALLAFLERAPTLGDSLLLNGDIFDFWFAYSRVIPRRSFHVAAEIRRARKRMPVAMVGGNHDRWGEDFWERDLDVRFAPLRMELAVGNRRVLAVHGDGVTESHWSASLMHRITRHPATVAVWKRVPPGFGFWVVDRMSHSLGNTVREDAALEGASRRQQAWGEEALRKDPGLGCVVMGHTHRPVLSEPRPGQQFLNPGAWLDGFKYGVVTETGAELAEWMG
ncbi:MAG TPA: UDP-2,3-diacylglucosamine diphosphatase [Gemmatimonadales bacterium]|nr:UDP-2,3-diacylglucosamine diphosphatase [Gemmatimonadales bacterium]